MSQTSDQLMKQFNLLLRASRYFMFQNQQPISGQKRVLAVLKLEDGLTQNYLADVLALRPGSLAELLKKMEAKGDIERVTDEKDKRVKRVYLTESGRKEAARISELKKQDTSAFFAGLTDEEQVTLSHYLEKIANGWDDDLKEQAHKFVDPAHRMEEITKWRKFAQHHNYSKDEMRDIRRKMRNCRYHDFDHVVAKDRYCDFAKMREYDRDFWRKFWHNEDDEN